MPSYSELMAIAGFRSKNAAFKLVERLIDHELLEKDTEENSYPEDSFTDCLSLGRLLLVSLHRPMKN